MVPLGWVWSLDFPAAISLLLLLFRFVGRLLAGFGFTSRWVELERHAVALRQATHDPAWLGLTEPEYARQTTTFVRALDGLVEAARRKDLEAAPQAYVAMTMSCVQCHRYVARRRMAGGAQEPAHD